jgi:hypothetical protein
MLMIEGEFCQLLSPAAKAVAARLTAKITSSSLYKLHEEVPLAT